MRDQGVFQKTIRILLASLFVMAFAGSTTAKTDKADSVKTKPKKGYLKILGMSCSMCAYGLHKKLSSMEEIEEAKIDFKTESGVLIFEPEAVVDYKRIEKAVREGGYTLSDMSLEAAGKVVREKEGLFFAIAGTKQRLPLKVTEESCPLVRKKAPKMENRNKG